MKDNGIPLPPHLNRVVDNIPPPPPLSSSKIPPPPIQNIPPPPVPLNIKETKSGKNWEKVSQETEFEEVKTVFDMSNEELNDLDRFNPHAYNDLPF